MKTIREPDYTQEELHRLFEYKDGELYWKVSTTNKVKVGDKAGTKKAHSRYHRVCIKRKIYLVHRVIYHYHNSLTNSMIDHIDGDSSNNSVENLRLCLPNQNQGNRKSTHKRKIDLPKGVAYMGGKRRKHYMAYITLNYKFKCLGYYETPELAHESYCLAADLAFGEFSNHG
jgi:hypothetical protein